MSVTIRDVAQHCGVSVATVSRVINNSNLVGDETKEKVSKSIQELGFVPNKIARGLSTKSTKMIGVLVPDISNSFFGELIEGIDKEASKAGYDILISNYKYVSENMYNDVIELKSRDVDGLIMASPLVSEETLDHLIQNKFPFVLTGPIKYDRPVNFVTVDNVQGAKIAVEHLISLGHTRIGYITSNQKCNYINELRLNGYNKALELNGIELDDSLIYDGTTEENLKRILNVTKENRPTALFAFNDMQALNMMEALELNGISVPKDISIVGFDNVKIASYYSIGLTTVDNCQLEFGKQAVKILLENIEKDRNKTQQIITIPDLVVRKSSCKK